MYIYIFICFLCKVHDGIKLKISTNSIRRVRWYTKLGFCKYPTIPLPISLESVLPRGGMIGSLSLVILRKYPKIYFERKPNSKPSKFNLVYINRIYVLMYYFSI